MKSEGKGFLEDSTECAKAWRKLNGFRGNRRTMRLEHNE